MPQPIEAVSSYARRVGDTIKVVITLPDDLQSQVGQRLTHRRVWLRFGHRVDGVREGFRVLAEVTPGARPRLVAEAPAASLPPGVWNLALRVGQNGPLVPLEARLLTSDTQPIALLAGPKPRTRMEEPAPR
ncbi:hypothetical protein [Nocardioides sp.]|uniref:hypothetical protein n=1 Tax=Nocardioides sp. TaxID=35761 RepID=UPI0027259FAA|nr:hypothetical protein [Nocardioides sp.]MDO9457462.1 hypothetical protein [Nocardioides sp.]